MAEARAQDDVQLMLAFRAGDVSALTRARITLGAFIGAQDYIGAQKRRRELARATAAAMEEADALIYPGMLGDPAPVDAVAPGSSSLMGSSAPSLDWGTAGATDWASRTLTASCRTIWAKVSVSPACALCLPFWLLAAPWRGALHPWHRVLKW